MKYDIHAARWTPVPKIVLDYRFTPKISSGLEYSHNVRTGEDSVSVGLNLKLVEWGKPR